MNKYNKSDADKISPWTVVFAWDEGWDTPKELIYINYIGNVIHPYVCVSNNWDYEKEYKEWKKVPVWFFDFISL